MPIPQHALHASRAKRLVATAAAVASAGLTAPSCHARCRRGAHVCGGSVREGGCTSCGRLCHANNDDRRCELPLQRGDLPLHGLLDAQQQLDTLAGTQGSVPHLSQLDWRRDGVTLAGKIRDPRGRSTIHSWHRCSRQSSDWRVPVRPLK